MGTRPKRRRLVVGFGGRGRCGAIPVRRRHGDERVDHQSGGAQRCRRSQGHRRVDSHPRSRSDQREPGRTRSAGPDGARRRHASGGSHVDDGTRGSVRPGCCPDTAHRSCRRLADRRRGDRRGLRAVHQDPRVAGGERQSPISRRARGTSRGRGMHAWARRWQPASTCSSPRPTGRPGSQTSLTATFSLVEARCARLRQFWAGRSSPCRWGSSTDFPWASHSSVQPSPKHR